MCHGQRRRPRPRLGLHNLGASILRDHIRRTCGVKRWVSFGASGCGVADIKVAIEVRVGDWLLEANEYLDASGQSLGALWGQGHARACLHIIMN